MGLSSPAKVQVARNAMATRFEIVLYGGDPVSLRAAAEEALDEVERLESKLSLYRSESEISHLNARAAYEPVRVSPELFRLLEQARELSRETGGAFDITVGPLMRAWGFVGGSGSLPDRQRLEAALECVGMRHLQLDPNSSAVRFARPGVMLDLGAIGKGYAIQKAAEILRDAGVASALIHGGTSTSLAIGVPPGQDSWKVAVARPPADANSLDSLVAIVPLRDSALSVSAVWGKAFQHAQITYGHVIDPRSGRPANSAILAAVALSSPTESDALSTALLTLGAEQEHIINNLRPDIRTLLIHTSDGANNFRVSSHGISPEADTAISTKPQLRLGESN